LSYRYEGDDIVIDGWEVGISNSPYQTQTNTVLVAQGVSDMRNVDIITVPGEASVAMSTQTMQSQGVITGVTFTVDPVTDIFTYNGVVPLEVNTAITVSNSGGALPTGMSTNTAYYIKTIPTSTTFTVSAVSAGGTTLNITGAGSGTNSFNTIQIGTPKYFASYLWPYFDAFEYFYFLQDSNGRVWVLDSANLSNSGKWVYMNSYSSSNQSIPDTANGLIAYRNYLFVFTGGSINVINILNAYPNSPSLAYLTTIGSWNFGWQITLTSYYSTISHQAIVSQNDSSIYFCNGQNVGTIFLVPNSIAATPDGNQFNIANTHTVADGVTTNTSTAISSVTAFFQATDVGAVIVGTGIPTGTIISAVLTNKTATLSAAATASNTGLTFTITSAYNYSGTILPLPPNEQATCLTELGDNLLVGGINNYIYPWDRVSTNFSQPIFLSENYTYQMVTVNTTTYLFVGERGRIFQTNGGNVQLFAKMPDHISGTVNPFYTWYGATFNRNQIYFGVSATTNAGVSINQYGGMWALDTDTKALRLLNQLSYGTYAGYASAMISNKGNSITSAQTNNGYGMFTGWYSGTVGGVDKGIASPYTGGQAYVESDIIPVGTFLKPKTYENIEFKLTTPLVTGESVALYYRTNITEAYTSLPLLSGGGVGELSGYASANFQNVQWIQIRPYLTSTASSPSFVRLKEIRIR
jgi:hypothetical protein